MVDKPTLKKRLPALRWLHAPAHVGAVNKAVVDFATSKKPLIIDWSEMYWDTGDLAKYAPDYRHFTGENGRVDGRGRVVNRDVAISIHKDAEIEFKREFFISREISTNLKYMPERHGKAIGIKYEGLKILVIAWHPQPRPFFRPKTVLPVYRRGVKRVQVNQIALEAMFEPDVVFNGGDLQLRRGPTWVYPNRLAKRLKMKFKHRGIDWQMWKGRGYKVGSFKKLDPKQANPKMDHPWTLLTLVDKDKK